MPIRIPGVLAATALAASLAAAPAVAGKPKPPSKTTIKKLLGAGYCQDSEGGHGVIATATLKLTSARIASPRLGNHRADGVPANRKTYVFPVRATLACDYHATPAAPAGMFVDDVVVSGDWVFFRDEFGSWTERNKGVRFKHTPGTN